MEALARRRARQGDIVWAYIFLLPFIVGLVLFVGGPIVAAVSISFTDWNLFTKPAFVGIENYAAIFHDPLFLKAVLNTLWYTLVTFPLGAIPALVLALALNKRFRGVAFFRGLFLLPSIVSIVAIGVAWAWLFNTQFGVINFVLHALGLATPDWLGSSQWALPVVIFVGTWRNIGYAVIIILAGLSNIPKEYYESVEIDGAGWWRKLWNLTLPMLSPTNFFLTIMTIIWSFQVFEVTYVMTKEGPAGSTLTIVYYIWEKGFPETRMGYASAQSVILFLVMLVICGLLIRSQRRWVHYE